MVNNTRQLVLEKLRTRAELFATKIAPIYISLNWTWGLGETQGVPTVEELQKCIERLIDDLIKNNGDKISTGGLTVEYDNKDKTGIITFSIEEIVYNERED